MTIKRRPLAPKPPHLNPELKQGQTYRIIGARSVTYQEYVDRYFTAACISGRTYLIYMEDSADSGGYDAGGVISSHGIEFVVANLQEV